MENVAVSQLTRTYRGRRVLVTGHTGFKGSWLSLWLTEIGARVTGIALNPPTSPSHWECLGLEVDDRRLDIRDYETLVRVFLQARPQIVFHLAAQPLVRQAFSQPAETWSTNVMGTVNILEACRKCADVHAVVVVTSDKCYENREWIWGYRENDRLGGHDPYSASKAAAELVAQSYRRVFANGRESPLIATARAGNVIGGGDWGRDRLIPDVVRARTEHRPVQLRFPKSVRPWQHILDCLVGYLQLGAALMSGKAEFATAWNFGPNQSGFRTVTDVLDQLRDQWPDLTWKVGASARDETSILLLDSSKARAELGWQPRYSFEQAVEVTAQWYDKYTQDRSAMSRSQLCDYLTSTNDS